MGTPILLLGTRMLAEEMLDLISEMPGVEVARVEVLPRFKPQERQGEVPGVVSVMVWPARPTIDFTAPYPRADRPLLESVHAHLDARRPLATELYVIGCAYKPLGLSVAGFLKAVRGEAPRPVVTGEEAARALDLALAVEQAVEG